MYFEECDKGPFYVPNNHRIQQKYDRKSGEQKKVKKNKKTLKEELRMKGHMVRGHVNREELNELAKKFEIELTCNIEVVEEGWLGKPKGLLQVLYERGWINENNVSEYTLKGKVNQKNEILPEHRRFSLRSLMSDCADLKEEKSAIEVLLLDLSKKSIDNHRKIELLVSPKYHCELAGEGVEYAWGMMKRYFRSLSLDKKNTKGKFEKVVRETVEGCVSKKNMELFSARCQRYMMAYSCLNNKDDKHSKSKSNRRLRRYRGQLDQSE